MKKQQNTYSEKPALEVIFSPALIPFYDIDNKTTAVVIDIFRATTLIVTAFEQGVEEVIPFNDLSLAQGFQKQGYLLVGERNAKVIEGFCYSNSPFKISKVDLRDKKFAMTTTNGTRAIEAVSNCENIFIGAFTNISALCERLHYVKDSLVLVCAGWRNRFNLEDSLFAGELTNRLAKTGKFTLSDSAIASRQVYLNCKEDFYKVIDNSSHRRRLLRLNCEEDIIYSLEKDLTDYIPYVKEGKIL